MQIKEKEMLFFSYHTDCLLIVCYKISESMTDASRKIGERGELFGLIVTGWGKIVRYI